jgi:hypothetical protein
MKRAAIEIIDDLPLNAASPPFGDPRRLLVLPGFSTP